MARYRNFRKKGKKNSSYSKKKIESVVRNMSETKHLTLTNNASIDNVGILRVLSSIDQGDDQFERIGNSVTCSYIDMRNYVIAADDTNIIRMILCTALVGPGEVTAADFPSGVNAFTGTMDYDKFRVHRDFSFAISTDGKDNAIKRIRFPLKRKWIYTDGTGTNQTKNPLYLWLVSDSGVASHPQIQYSMKIFYKDV